MFLPQGDQCHTVLGAENNVIAKMRVRVAHITALLLSPLPGFVGCLHLFPTIPLRCIVGYQSVAPPALVDYDTFLNEAVLAGQASHGTVSPDEHATPSN